MNLLRRLKRTPPVFTGGRAYALAVATIVVATVLTRLASPVLSRTPFVLLFCAVYLVARFCTPGAGWLAVALGAVGTVVASPALGQAPLDWPFVIGYIAVAGVANYLVSDRNRAMAALSASEARFRATWEYGALGAALLDRSGTVLHVNPALERLLGHQASAWIGGRFDVFSQAGDAESKRGRFAELMRGSIPYYQGEYQYRRLDQTLCWGRVTLSSIRAVNGAPTGALMLLEDVTSRRQAEADLRASEEKLRRSQKMEAVGQLVAGVAHHFNNLLTVATGYTDLLMERHASVDQDHADLLEIRGALGRGAVLTRQLLGFSRKQDHVAARVNLGKMVTDLREILLRAVREDIQLTMTVAPTPTTVFLNPQDLEQVIMNLVVNARDAQPDGGAIHIDVAPQAIDAASAPADPTVAPGDFVRLRVRDEGIGMTPDVQAHLFEPFFTTKDVGKGTGLGLAFVYGIVRHHRGFITVDTAPGGGTTFTVYLPFASGAPSAVRDERALPVATETATSKNATILLVEDEDDVRAVTARTLNRAGYRVLEAASPSEACTIFDENALDIDLLLTDVVMPEMRGPVLAERLIARRRDLNVLFVSGYNDGRTSTTTSGTGRVQFLEKPFTPSRLVRTLDELLSVPQGSSGELRS